MKEVPSTPRTCLAACPCNELCIFKIDSSAIILYYDAVPIDSYQGVPMIRNVFTLSAMCATIALAGCSANSETDKGPADPPPVDPETTVTIDGRQWTCEQITASEPQECGELTQQAFDSHKENIDAYVNGGRLGPLNDGSAFSYEDAAFAGLVACAYMMDGGNENDYIDFMMQTEPFKTKLSERVGYLPAWHEAPKSLCTDEKPPNPNPGSVVVP